MGGSKGPLGGIGTDRLTDAEVRRAKAAAAPYKLADGKGLYLLVQPTGSKLWRVKYRHQGVERTYSIGAYPEITLAKAREERNRAREWLREGRDPTIERRNVKAFGAVQQASTFGAMAAEWFTVASAKWSEVHKVHQRRLLDRDILPSLGPLPLVEVKPATVLETLRKIEARGAFELASKCRVIVSQVYRYAAQTSRADSDPASLLGGALTKPPPVHRATIPAKEFPALFKALRAVPAEAVTKAALYWLMLTATRTSETRFATWGEIEGGKLWRIPPERMKMTREHVVPLSRQAQAILETVKPLRTENSPEALLFPGFTRHGALSENAFLALLARAGFFGRQTAHGFRASFSTWAHEVAEADPDVVEACLAHVRGDVRAVYNRAQYLSKRAELLQRWADQLSAWGMKP